MSESASQGIAKAHNVLSSLLPVKPTLPPINGEKAKLEKRKKEYKILANKIRREEESKKERRIQEKKRSSQEKAKLAEEKGYELIIKKGSTGSLMYGTKSLDITDEVVKRLNSTYNEKKKAN